jgi:di- and tripeptidase
VKATLHGHTGSVLALEIAREKEWLFSSSGKPVHVYIGNGSSCLAGDSTVRIWSTRDLTALCILTPHLDTSSGDIFSLIFSSTLQTLYFGCQNTSLQWYDFSKTNRRCALRRTSSMDPSYTDERESDADAGLAMSLDRKKWHRFFDNTPRIGKPIGSPTTPSIHTSSGTSTPSSGHLRVLQVSSQNIIHSAHFGYIYCMALLPNPGESIMQCDNGGGQDKSEENVLLLTGSGDETVKVRQTSPLHLSSPSVD